MMQSRRFFLKSMGLGAGAMMLTPWNMPKLRAAPKNGVERNFIFCYFNGGWDTLMCIDPRDPYDYPETKIGQTKIQLAWDRFSDDFSKDPIKPKGSNIMFGPAIGDFAKHYDVTCAVRGLSMDTVTHEVGRRYFITGMPPAGLNALGSSIPTRIVAQQGDNAPIPNLVARVETYNQGLPAYASGLRVSSISDLLSTLRDGPQAPDTEMRALLEAYRRSNENCDPVNLNADKLLSLLRTAQTKSRFLVDSNLGGLFSFTNTRDPEMVKIRSRYSINSLTSPEAQAAMAYQAVKHQVAQCITIELASGLDSHSEEWSTVHPTKLRAGFNALSKLVDDLKSTEHPKGGNLLDYTTIAVFSEFTRTALINNRDGRDHSLTNSCLLIGAGVPHNKVVGRSSAVGMNPEAIDPISGKAGTGNSNVVLNPRLVSASLMEAAGYDVKKFRVNGLPCLMDKTS